MKPAGKIVNAHAALSLSPKDTNRPVQEPASSAMEVITKSSAPPTKLGLRKTLLGNVHSQKVIQDPARRPRVTITFSRKLFKAKIKSTNYSPSLSTTARTNLLNASRMARALMSTMKRKTLNRMIHLKM